jgi:hypothetical protein
MQDDIAAYKIDPSRYWADASTGQKVVAAISVFLGGFGAGKGPNQALAQINKYVDDEIASQKAELGKKQNQLSMYMEETKDLRQAEEMVRADLLRVAGFQMQRLGAKYDGGMAKVAADKGAAELLFKAADTDYKNAASTEGRKNQQAMLAYDAAKTNVSLGISDQQRRMATVKELKDNIIPMPGGAEPRVARNAEGGQIANAKTAAYRDVMAQVKKVEDMIEQNKRGTLPWSTARANAVTALNQLRLDYQALIKGNASENENAIVANALPTGIAELKASSVFNEDYLRTQMAQIKATADSKLTAVHNQYTMPVSQYLGMRQMSMSASSGSRPVGAPATKPVNLNPPKVK